LIILFGFDYFSRTSALSRQCKCNIDTAIPAVRLTVKSQVVVLCIYVVYFAVKPHHCPLHEPGSLYGRNRQRQQTSACKPV